MKKKILLVLLCMCMSVIILSGTVFAIGESYTVSFNNNGGGGEMAAVTQNEGFYRLPKCTFTPPDEGMILAGWAINSSDEVVYLPEAEIYINGDTTLYAVWR